MTSPIRPTRSDVPDRDELVDVYADKAPPAVLRMLQREHGMWMLGFAGVALIFLVLPDSTWYWSLIRYGGLVGIALGWVRVMQSNGIRREITRRNEEALRVSRREAAARTARLSREALAEDIRESLDGDR